MNSRRNDTRLLLTRLLLLGLLTFVGGFAFAQTTGPKITTSSKLFPDFDPNISDYVIPAGPDASVTVTVDSPTNIFVSVDSQPFNTRKFTTTLPNVSEGRSFKIAIWSLRGGINGCGELKLYNVRRLPADFPGWTTERPGTPQAEFYVFAPNLFGDRHYVIVADNYGVPIWWYRGNAVPVDPKLLSNNRIGWMNFGPGEEHVVDGTRTQTFLPAAPIGGSMDPHDLLLLPNGNYAYIVLLWRGPVDLRPYGGPIDGYVGDNIIEEVTPGGKLVWSWSSMDHISLNETAPAWRWLLGGQYVDPFHMNSIERTQSGYVVSLRHLDAVIAVDRATGRKAWKLGGVRRPESLTFVGDSHNNFGGNHDARILPDGTLTLHDNGTGQGRAPRAVRFRIDTAARTATLMEQVTDSKAPSSGFTGSARRLPTGNWVTEWGGNPYVTELAPNGNLVFRMSFLEPFFSYRAVPLMPGRISRTFLRDGMDRQFPR